MAGPLPNDTTEFSSRKRSILELLKANPDSTLASVAKALGVSRAATLRHLASLENDGFVQRTYLTGRVGRPPASFRVTSCAQWLFPQAYVQLSLSAMDYIEKVLGRPAVVRMLEERGLELRRAHQSHFDSPALSERARQLARLRDREGYMASFKRSRRESFEIVEHNCPILAIAGKYGEACDVERRFFQDILRADVTVSHRLVAGDPVCRFLVKDRTPVTGPA
jgi:DeoR family transcriptional regulator, suf operon transcriptional repressor